MSVELEAAGDAATTDEAVPMAGELDGTDRALEAAFLMLMATGGRHRIVCPTEAAQLVSPERWFALMSKARAAALRLARNGGLRLLQDGCMLDPQACDTEDAFKVVFTLPPDLAARSEMRDFTRTLRAVDPQHFSESA